MNKMGDIHKKIALILRYALQVLSLQHKENKFMEQIVEKYINPLTDFGFKRIFGTEFNKDLLISFLNALFEGKEDIEQ